MGVNTEYFLFETWRPESPERLDIGNCFFYGADKQETPRGNGAGIPVHKSIEVESWHHIASRITAIRVPYGRRRLMIFSAYAPVQQGGNTSPRTTQFYDHLAEMVREARSRGDIVIIGAI